MAKDKKSDAPQANAAPTETKAVAVPQPAGALSTELAGEFDFGGDTMFNFRDLIIPKLLVMQGLSKLVASGDAKMGDIVDTAANSVVGSVREKDRKPIRFFPIQMFRYWVQREVTADGMKFKSATPWTPENADTPWDVMEGEKKIAKNEETVVFAVVREDMIDDMEEPPRLITFRSTSLKQTKQIKHHFLMCYSTRKEVPFQTVFELSGRLDKNERNESWYLPEVMPKEKASDEQARKLMALYKRYAPMIKEKVAGFLDDDELTPASQGAAAGPRDITPPPVEAEGERAKF